jgi:FRG domain-containing protein
MYAIHTSSWEDFELKFQEFKKSISGGLTGFLFRGHAEASWPLTTTLERATSRNSVHDYYQMIRVINPEIEAFTDKQWPFPDYQEIRELATNYDAFGLKLLSGDLPAYSYMMYLRHHGFPSPLLDWSHSPYVAAYFAFRVPSKDRVAIYVFSEAPNNSKSRSSNEPTIYGLGPYARSHKRHFVQQSRYTICVQFDQGNPGPEWYFTRHDTVFKREGDQDVLMKFTIPGSERTKVLKLLDQYNLNAFSLFGSEESLMDTLALRALDFHTPA